MKGSKFPHISFQLFYTNNHFFEKKTERKQKICWRLKKMLKCCKKKIEELFLINFLGTDDEIRDSQIHMTFTFHISAYGKFIQKQERCKEFIEDMCLVYFVRWIYFDKTTKLKEESEIGRHCVVEYLHFLIQNTTLNIQHEHKSDNNLQYVWLVYGRNLI